MAVWPSCRILKWYCIARGSRIQSGNGAYRANVAGVTEQTWYGFRPSAQRAQIRFRLNSVARREPVDNLCPLQHLRQHEIVSRHAHKHFLGFRNIHRLRDVADFLGLPALMRHAYLPVYLPTPTTPADPLYSSPI